MIKIINLIIIIKSKFILYIIKIVKYITHIKSNIKYL